MDTEPSKAKLLNQADDIIHRVEQIIVERGDVDEDSKQIRDLYSPWKRAVNRYLDADQKARFRKEYQGSIAQPKIRKCLEGIDKRPHVSKTRKSFEQFAGTWHDQLEAYFIHPFNEQCEILREATVQVTTWPDEILDQLKAMCRRLPEVLRYLETDTKRRPAWTMRDEYDVQDLFSILLKSQFDDVRPEQSAPSFAGRGFRIDFWLKNERICIEIKMTRDGLGAKQLRTELFEDIAQYQKFPNAEGLFIYVHDPNRRVPNSSAFESDINESANGFPIRTVVGH